MNALNGLRWSLCLLGAAHLGGLPGADASVPLTGGNYAVVGQVTGGGGTATAGSVAMVGSMAQPAVGESSGGAYRLTGGLVGAIVVPTPGAPEVTIVFTEDKLVRLSWATNTTGFVLEVSDTVGPSAAWQPVSPQPTDNRFTTPCTQPARFYRLRRL